MLRVLLLSVAMLAHLHLSVLSSALALQGLTMGVD